MNLDKIKRLLNRKRLSMDDYLTAAEVATALGVGRSWISRLVREGRLMAVQVGNMHLIHRDEVARYQSERKPPGRPTARRGRRKSGY